MPILFYINLAMTVMMMVSEFITDDKTTFFMPHIFGLVPKLLCIKSFTWPSQEKTFFLFTPADTILQSYPITIYRTNVQMSSILQFHKFRPLLLEHLHYLIREDLFSSLQPLSQRNNIASLLLLYYFHVKCPDELHSLVPPVQTSTTKTCQTISESNPLHFFHITPSLI